MCIIVTMSPLQASAPATNHTTRLITRHTKTPRNWRDFPRRPRSPRRVPAPPARPERPLPVAAATPRDKLAPARASARFRRASAACRAPTRAGTPPPAAPKTAGFGLNRHACFDVRHTSPSACGQGADARVRLPRGWARAAAACSASPTRRNPFSAPGRSAALAPCAPKRALSAGPAERGRRAPKPLPRLDRWTESGQGLHLRASHPGKRPPKRPTGAPAAVAMHEARGRGHLAAGQIQRAAAVVAIGAAHAVSAPGACHTEWAARKTAPASTDKRLFVRLGAAGCTGRAASSRRPSPLPLPAPVESGTRGTDRRIADRLGWSCDDAKERTRPRRGGRGRELPRTRIEGCRSRGS